MSAAEAHSVVQSLLKPDAPQFERFLGELMSPDNARRKFAEDVLRELKQHADLFVRYLITTLRNSSAVAHRAFSAMLLRKGLTIESPVLWSQLSEAVRHEVKGELLAALGTEKDTDVLQKTADATSELARYLLLGVGWPELTGAIVQMLESPSADVRVSAYRMIGTLAENETFELFTTASHQLLINLERGLHQGPATVQSEAIAALCNIVVEKGPLTDALKPMLPKIILVLMDLLEKLQVDAAETVLESLIEVAEESPKFLKPHLRELFEPMLKVACSESVDQSLRVLSVELLLSIIEQKDAVPSVLKIVPNFVRCLFEVLMLYLLDIEDDPAWHVADDADESIGNGDIYNFGVDSLDRLAMAVGGRILVPVAGATLNGCMTDANWKKRHAALMCLSQIAEGCEKVMLNEIDGLTDMCMTGMSDAVPKVRWASCQAIGQMCTDLAPDIQGTQHHKILPKLIATMEDATHPRVQAHAATAIVNFGELCEEEDVLPYLDGLVQMLVRLLHSPSRLVMEAALVALAKVAECVNEHFGTYYDAVMPLLRRMFVEARDPKLQDLRAKALECISLVGAAVGADRFRDDARDIMQMIHELHQVPMSPSDPLPSYMIQAGARMCQSLKREFVPYLEIVMPHVLRHLAADPEMKLKNPEDLDSEDEDQETFHIGGKLIRLRSSVMEDKADALQMVACYAQVLKDGFLPYLKPVTDLVVSSLKFLFNEEVRIGAFKCLPELLGVAIAGMHNQKGISPEFLQHMVAFMWPAAIEALVNEDELDVQEAGLQSTAAMIDVLTPQLLSQQMVEACFKMLQTLFDEYEDRRNKRIDDAALSEDEGIDDIENDAPLDEEEEMEMEVIDQMATVLSSFMKKYGDEVMPYVLKMMPVVHALLSAGRTPTEKRIAVCIIDDILDRCPQAGNNYLHEFLPFLIDGSMNEDPNLRQCCIYGLGVVATKYPEAFQPRIPELLPRLIEAVRHPAAKSRENELATDNAVSTIGKILRQFPDKVDPEVVDQVWLRNLPLLHDDLEAKTMHEQLVSMVEQQDPRVLGGNNQNLMNVIEILVRVLAAGKLMTTRETATRIYNLLQSFSQSMGPEALTAAVTKMTPKQQKVFHDFSTALGQSISQA